MITNVLSHWQGMRPSSYQALLQSANGNHCPPFLDCSRTFEGGPAARVLKGPGSLWKSGMFQWKQSSDQNAKGGVPLP